jgi:mRNA interferase MazF
MVIQRGDVWWAALDAPQGSSPGYFHPVVIIQGDDFNKSRINKPLTYFGVFFHEKL